MTPVVEGTPVVAGLLGDCRRGSGKLSAMLEPPPPLQPVFASARARTPPEFRFGGANEVAVFGLLGGSGQRWFRYCAGFGELQHAVFDRGFAHFFEVGEVVLVLAPGGLWALFGCDCEGALDVAA